MNILCFGDSNTFGHDPRGYWGSRYEEPWPQLLSKKFGWNVLNLGQCGREIPQCQIIFPKDIDLLLIMLGTNDLLQGNSVATVTNRMEVFLESIDLEKSKLFLLSPPPMKLGAWVPSHQFIEASKELAYAYQEISQRLGIQFVNTNGWNIPLTFDGVHFTDEGHRAFGLELANYLIKNPGNWYESQTIYAER